ncbi:hypothetical protein FDECE_18514, partial [Fusarium decemcellulare]
MADLDLKAVHDELISVAYEAGAMILAANPAELDTGTKLNSVDIVTEADKGVEKMVSTSLSSAFPSISFMGEETYKPGMKLGPEPTFVVDPIDGTTNFVHSFPSACISLGLAVDRQPAVGVIYNPWLDLEVKVGPVTGRSPLDGNERAAEALDRPRGAGERESLRLGASALGEEGTAALDSGVEVVEPGVV